MNLASDIRDWHTTLTATRIPDTTMTLQAHPIRHHLAISGFAAMVVVGASLVVPGVLAAQQLSQSEQAQLTRWFRSARQSAPGEWGVAIADQNGNVLWGVEPDEPLVPASTVKVLTTGFGRSVVGGDARRETRVLGSGQVDAMSGAWTGRWALELNGDPSLERGSGPTLDQLADQLRALGIRSLKGRLEVRSAAGPADATFPAAWSSRHRGRLFAPLVGALTINENTIAFRIKPGAKVGAPAVMSWERPRGVRSLVRIDAATVSGRAARLKVRTTSGGGWVVSGTIGSRARSQYLAVPATSPEVVLNAAWSSALRRAGVRWTSRRGPQPVDTTTPRVLASVSSATYDSLALDINKRSNNLGAELLLRWAGGPNGSANQLTEHVRLVSGSDAVRLVDGSGLSSQDRVAPSAFTAYLARFPSTAGGRNFPQLLPAAGSGTLKGLQRGLPARGVVRAKTGTLRRVSAIVGYLGRRDGVLTISLMYNGPRPNAARRAQWKLFRQLGANGVIVPDDFGERDPIQLGAEMRPIDPGFEVYLLERALSGTMPAPDRAAGR
jgi:D-alanyl-D-alanine carboxypeptidase/D-alanyl-D-alanine-endopeptidase (penicillin-binding protein 4)